MPGGSSSSGRNLTREELELIQAQKGAFESSTQFQNFANIQAQKAAQQSGANLGALFGAAGLGANQLQNLSNQAVSQGLGRRASEVANLQAAQGLLGGFRGANLPLSLAGNLQTATDMARRNAQAPIDMASNATLAALGRQALSPAYLDTLTSRFQTAANRLQPVGTRQFQDVFRQAMAQQAGLRTSEAQPLLRDVFGQAMDRTSATPLADQIAFLSGVGREAGAAEQALTPQAIQLLQTAQGGTVPNAISQLFAPDTVGRSNLENQFQVARQRLVESGVRGGALNRALAGLEGQRALGIASNAQEQENAARAATLGLLQQATTFGLTQPFEREQLAMAATQAAGGLGAQQAGLQQQALDLGRMTAGAIGEEALQRGALRGQLLGIGQSATEGMANERLQLQGLRNQLFGLSAQTAEAAFQGRLGARGLQQQALQNAQANALAARELRGQQIGLAGSLGAQQVASNLAIRQAQSDNLAREMAARLDIAGRLGAGADSLAFGVAPSLTTQGVTLRELMARAPSIPVDILRGGGPGGVRDLSGALAAASNAANFRDTEPSPFAAGAMGALSGGMGGAGIGFMAGGPIGAIAGGAGGALLGLLGGVL